MVNKKKLDNYEFTVENQEYIPDRENPERIELTVSFEYDGESYTVTPPAFEPKQVANGQWEMETCIYIDKKIQEVECSCQHEVPDLRGERIENTGYDFTGSRREYPE